MMRTPREALRWIRRHAIATMTPTRRFQSLVTEVVGGPVRGSWWSHPKGQVIFRLGESLHDSADVLTAKLVDGKITLLHRALWPALARFVMDPIRRRETMARLSPVAKKRLRAVERLGSLQLEKSTLAGSKELELSLLVHSGSVHTEKGSHATV